MFADKLERGTTGCSQTEIKFQEARHGRSITVLLSEFKVRRLWQTRRRKLDGVHAFWQEETPAPALLPDVSRTIF
jgi:hypothetical protein